MEPNGREGGGRRRQQQQQQQEEDGEEEEGSWIHFTVVYLFLIKWAYFGILI